MTRAVPEASYEGHESIVDEVKSRIGWVATTAIANLEASGNPDSSGTYQVDADLPSARMFDWSVTTTSYPMEQQLAVAAIQGGYTLNRVLVRSHQITPRETATRDQASPRSAANYIVARFTRQVSGATYVYFVGANDSGEVALPGSMAGDNHFHGPGYQLSVGSPIHASQLEQKFLQSYMDAIAAAGIVAASAGVSQSDLLMEVSALQSLGGPKGTSPSEFAQSWFNDPQPYTSPG